MNIGEAQQKVLKLVRLAASAPGSEEARTAASKAACLIAEHGLLIMKPSDLVHVVDASHEALLARIAELEAALRDAPPVGTKKRRKRPNAKAIQETMTTAAETARTAAETAGAALDAASRVAKAVNGFRNAIRGG